MSDSTFSSVAKSEDRESIKCKTAAVVRSYNIRWEISNFNYIIKNMGECIESSTFRTGTNPKIDWKIQLYPSGCKSRGNLSVYLRNKSNFDATVEYRLSILSQEGAELQTAKSGLKKIVPKADWGFEKLITLEELKTDSELLPNGNLTLLIKLEALDGPDGNPCCNKDNLSEDLGKLLKSSEWSDSTISVGERMFPVHKNVLMARSPTFTAMFNEYMEADSRSNTVYIADTNPDVMEEVLLYIYTGKCKRINEMPGELIQAAEKYDLVGLKDLCEEVLVEQLTTENAADTLILADLLKRKQLKRKTLDFIMKHSNEVVISSSWKKMAVSHSNLELEGLRVIVNHLIMHKKT